MRFLLSFLFGIVFALYSCTYENKEPETPVVELCDTLDVSYANDVSTIILMNCSSPSCHGENGTFGDMSTYDLFKNYVDQGKITDRVIEQKNMPPSGPLSDEDINTLNCWIENGAENN